MQNFNSASFTSINSPECDYQSFILQQKHLINKIHSQEKKLRSFHKNAAVSSANPALTSTSFLKRHNTFNSKNDRPEYRSSSHCSGFDRLKISMPLCAPMPLHSTGLPAPSKNFKGNTNSENSFNRHNNFITYFLLIMSNQKNRNQARSILLILLIN